MTAYRPTPTLRSRHVLAMDFIRQYFVDHGCSPSFSEIASALGISAQHVGRLVRELLSEGHIGWTPGEPRSITLPELLDGQSTSQLLLALMRRGWVVNPEKIITEPTDVTNCGVPPEELIADIEAAVEGLSNGQGDEEDPGHEPGGTGDAG